MKAVIEKQRELVKVLKSFLPNIQNDDINRLESELASLEAGEEKCRECIYLNEIGNCWAIKGKADITNKLCDFSPIVDKEQPSKESQKEKNLKILDEMANQDALLRDMEEPQGADWNTDKVIDFVNWYLRLCKVITNNNCRFELENQSIIDSFFNGDDYKLWWNKLGKEQDSKEPQGAEEIYKKVYIKSKNDLPKDGCYLIKLNDNYIGLSDDGLRLHRIDRNSNRYSNSKLEWLDHVDWYFQSMEEYASQRMPTEEKLREIAKGFEENVYEDAMSPRTIWFIGAKWVKYYNNQT